VGFFGFWIISKFVTNIKTLREEARAMAAKTNSKTFAVGVMLAISFFAVLALIFSPVFGADKDGNQ